MLVTDYNKQPDKDMSLQSQLFCTVGFEPFYFYFKFIWNFQSIIERILWNSGVFILTLGNNWNSYIYHIITSFLHHYSRSLPPHSQTWLLQKHHCHFWPSFYWYAKPLVTNQKIVYWIICLKVKHFSALFFSACFFTDKLFKHNSMKMTKQRI